jgi:uncharacterized coiled-coil protein SlyX
MTSTTGMSDPTQAKMPLETNATIQWLDPFRVVALIAAYNEEDILGTVVADLVDQGVMVYIIDHGSTDSTREVVEPYLGKGLIAVERFTDPESVPNQAFQWEHILKRKETLARELDAHWFIHHDADEFRESPWKDRTLAQAIRMVDRFGYNAVDFQVFNFWPTHEGFQPGDDPRKAFPSYAPGESFNKIQVRCWKKTPGHVDIASTGGHDAAFPNRKVFPIRFILRHYPIRGQHHGERKVFAERRGRFVASERARGWHVQYDGIFEGDSFVRDPATLTIFDPDAARLQLMLQHRGVEELESRVVSAEHVVHDLTGRQAAEQRLIDTLRHDVDRLTNDLQSRTQETQRLLGIVERSQSEHERLHAELQNGRDAVLRLEAEIHRLNGVLAVAQSTREEVHSALRQNQLLSDELAAARHHVRALLNSASWRWMAPLRAARRLFTRVER